MFQIRSKISNTRNNENQVTPHKHSKNSEGGKNMQEGRQINLIDVLEKIMRSSIEELKHVPNLDPFNYSIVM